MKMSIPDPIRFKLLDAIFPSLDARFFHVVQTENWAQILSDSVRGEPVFIPEEEHAQSLIGLAEAIGIASPDGIIKGQKFCIDYLQIAVDKLWEQIETRLRPFNRATVVKMCFNALAELEKDAEHWCMTARSQLAVHASQSEVLEVAEERCGKRDAAALVNRLLIETAMYACAIADGFPFPHSEHLEILAHMQNLVSTANHRDAISAGFMPAEIRVFPNGELDVDDKFYVSIMAPYVQAKFADKFQSWAGYYDSWFSDYQSEENPDAVETLRRLEEPFATEFGVTIDQLVSIPNSFGRHARKTNSLILEFNDAAIRSFLEAECGASCFGGGDFPNAVLAFSASSVGPKTCRRE